MRDLLGTVSSLFWYGEMRAARLAGSSAGMISFDRFILSELSGCHNMASIHQLYTVSSSYCSNNQFVFPLFLPSFFFFNLSLYRKKYGRSIHRFHAPALMYTYKFETIILSLFFKPRLDIYRYHLMSQKYLFLIEKKAHSSGTLRKHNFV